MNCIYCKKKLTMLDMVNDNTLECPLCGTHQVNTIVNVELEYAKKYIPGFKGVWEFKPKIEMKASLFVKVYNGEKL